MEALPYIGTAVGIWGGISSAKAQKKAADDLLNLAQPYLQTGAWGSSALRNLILEQFYPLLGKRSELIEAGRQRSLEGLFKSSGREISKSKAVASALGNESMARGAALAISSKTREQQNVIEQTSATGQEQYMAQNRETVARLLDAIAGRGAGVLGGVGGALGAKASATGEMWGDIAGSLGWGAGMFQGMKEQDLINSLLEEEKKSKVKGASTSKAMPQPTSWVFGKKFGS